MKELDMEEIFQKMKNNTFNLYNNESYSNLSKINKDYLNLRNAIFRVLYKIATKLEFENRTFFLSMQYLDIIFAKNKIIKINSYKLGLACLCLSSKFCEIDKIVPHLRLFSKVFNYILDYKNIISANELRIIESYVCKLLDYKLNYYSIYDFNFFFFSNGILINEQLEHIKNNFTINYKNKEKNISFNSYVVENILDKIYNKSSYYLENIIKIYEIIIKYNPLFISLLIMKKSIKEILEKEFNIIQKENEKIDFFKKNDLYFKELMSEFYKLDYESNEQYKQLINEPEIKKIFERKENINKINKRNFSLKRNRSISNEKKNIAIFLKNLDKINIENIKNKNHYQNINNHGNTDRKYFHEINSFARIENNSIEDNINLLKRNKDKQHDNNKIISIKLEKININNNKYNEYKKKFSNKKNQKNNNKSIQNIDRSFIRIEKNNLNSSKNNNNFILTNKKKIFIKKSIIDNVDFVSSKKNLNKSESLNHLYLNEKNLFEQNNQYENKIENSRNSLYNKLKINQNFFGNNKTKENKFINRIKLNSHRDYKKKEKDYQDLDNKVPISDRSYLNKSNYLYNTMNKNPLTNKINSQNALNHEKNNISSINHRLKKKENIFFNPNQSNQLKNENKDFNKKNIRYKYLFDNKIIYLNKKNMYNKVQFSQSSKNILKNNNKAKKKKSFYNYNNYHLLDNNIKEIKSKEKNNKNISQSTSKKNKRSLYLNKSQENILKKKFIKRGNKFKINNNKNKNEEKSLINKDIKKSNKNYGPNGISSIIINNTININAKKIPKLKINEITSYDNNNNKSSSNRKIVGFRNCYTSRTEQEYNFFNSLFYKFQANNRLLFNNNK